MKSGTQRPLHRFPPGWWWSAPIHQVLATIGTLAITGQLGYMFFPPEKARSLLLLTRFFPFQLAVGIVLGFFATHFLRRTFAVWVWVPPLLVLAVSIILATGPVGSRLGEFFSDVCAPGPGCIVRVSVTLPFYASLAYALGALVSRGWRKQASPTSLTQP